ncbi:outer membrane lipoprotein-sorting protein [Halobacteriovorax sp. HLS]|uniref:outer membrane lipoprotein-sorting protein n=1 Tax=Halobacteriovorax sp. HLS TaxID=2234000 RepID=UPI000FD87E24|nr:outer membrane lipoprotein-sorting protein [Halobacteriovorax sp. HLS]
MRSLFNFCLISILTLSAFSVAAETPEQKGLRIATEAEKRNNGFVAEESDLEMILIDAYGSKITRKMKGMVLEVQGDGDKSLNIFLNPADVKGTKMLTWSHKDKDDKQWLYLPSLRRVKKISSSNKSSSFMGSEFSYEDIGSQEVEKYSFKFLKDGKSKSGEEVYFVQRIPKSKSGYSKQIVQITKKDLSAVYIEYYDRKGELLKIADIQDFKTYKVKGKSIRRASKIHMKNLQTKKESIFLWNNRKLGVKLKDNDFTKRALK